MGWDVFFFYEKFSEKRNLSVSRGGKKKKMRV